MEGISFIVRIRDEEDTLEESIRSLSTLRIPHEIILILHMCRDRSLEIAERLAAENENVRVLEYNIPISRAGYETLCTDRNSKHSLPKYYEWCFNQGTLPWRFKWDADFIATPEFIEYLNRNTWERPTEGVEVAFSAVSPDSTNKERYLFSGPFTYFKCYFWEVYQLSGSVYRWDPEISIIHNSKLSKKKSYWDNLPWFLDSSYLDSDEDAKNEARIVLERYNTLSQLCGPEPNGQARASNPESSPIYDKVSRMTEILKQSGIDPYN